MNPDGLKSLDCSLGPKARRSDIFILSVDPNFFLIFNVKNIIPARYLYFLVLAVTGRYFASLIYMYCCNYCDWNVRISLLDSVIIFIFDLRVSLPKARAMVMRPKGAAGNGCASRCGKKTDS